MTIINSGGNCYFNNVSNFKTISHKFTGTPLLYTSLLEAGIFSGIPQDGKQNRYESRDWDGRGKNLIGSGRDRESNFTHKYTFYINKL